MYTIKEYPLEMNYQPYPENYWTQIEKNIAELKNSQKKLVAAFDADGTLWDADLGENFFQYQIDHKLVELPPDQRLPDAGGGADDLVLVLAAAALLVL